MKRLKFLEGEQKKYLDLALKLSGLNSDQMGKLVGVVGRSFRDWKREKLMMSLEASKIIKQKFHLELPETEDVLIKRATDYKTNLGRIGGMACYKRYGNFATAEGRRRGGSKTLKILREKGIVPEANHFDFPKTYTQYLAEFVGILLGDGGITSSQVCITLNSIEDRDYLVYVVGLIKSLFNFEAYWTKLKNCNANTIYCNGTELVKYLLGTGLKVGNKVRQQVDVPNWIKQDREFSVACIRGLMDTDGGIFIHKYIVNKKEYRYLKICFTNRSVPLLKFMDKVLKDLKFNPKLVLDRENKKLWLYNQSEVLRYIKVVGTHNSRLLKNIGLLEESDSWSIREVC